MSVTTNAVEGRKRFSGRLVGLVDGRAVVECDGETLEFELDQIRRCTIKPNFDSPAKPGKRN